MRSSSFQDDLTKERLLAAFLDGIYVKNLRQYTFERVTHIERQLLGIDLTLTHKTSGKSYHIDEKSQLDYINEDLPTFAFELSYLKKKKERLGWLFDQKKKTDFYALVTAIFQDDNEYSSCKITLVNRNRLIALLTNLGFQADTIKSHRTNGVHGKTTLPFLDPKTQGYLYLSKNNKVEQPLNLVLRLEWLLRSGVAKRLV
ncbi:hypothetical protein [uncultured Croceitalea sp.]|uniref:hypothetical protein n=1 Tax=uncultured Croceitalea sp. TaxID=1798908 RepID=UPI003305AEA4